MSSLAIGIATNNSQVSQLFSQLLPQASLFQAPLPYAKGDTLWIVDDGIAPLEGLLCLCLRNAPEEASPYPILRLPFSLGELLTALDRLTSSSKVVLGPFTLDRVSRILSHPDHPHLLTLTEKEAELLCLLHEHPERTFSREDLLETIWNYEPDLMTHTVETHIYRLRKKLAMFPGGARLVESYPSGYGLHLSS